MIQFTRCWFLPSNHQLSRSIKQSVRPTEGWQIRASCSTQKMLRCLHTMDNLQQLILSKFSRNIHWKAKFPNLSIICYFPLAIKLPMIDQSQCIMVTCMMNLQKQYYMRYVYLFHNKFRYNQECSYIAILINHLNQHMSHHYDKFALDIHQQLEIKLK